MTSKTVDNKTELETCRSTIARLQKEISEGVLLKHQADLNRSLIALQKEKEKRLMMMPPTQTIIVPTKNHGQYLIRVGTGPMQQKEFLLKQQGYVVIVDEIKNALSEAGIKVTKPIIIYSSQTCDWIIKREKRTKKLGPTKKPKFFIKSSDMKIILPEIIASVRKRFSI